MNNFQVPPRGRAHALRLREHTSRHIHLAQHAGRAQVYQRCRHFVRLAITRQDLRELVHRPGPARLYVRTRSHTRTYVHACAHARAHAHMLFVDPLVSLLSQPPPPPVRPTAQNRRVAVGDWRILRSSASKGTRSSRPTRTLGRLVKNISTLFSISSIFCVETLPDRAIAPCERLCRDLPASPRG